MSNQNTAFDVVIIGGSYAGLSAAMTLGRSLRKVLVIDSGRPCNWQTPHSHNFITQDGETPAAIAAKAKEQVLRYPSVSFYAGTAVKAIKKEERFEVFTDDNSSFQARKLLLATGITDLMPAMPGFTACWGISVLHCPYCHGYEVSGKRFGIFANGETAYEMSKLIHQWTKYITLFTNGAHGLTETQLLKLHSHNITVIEKEVKSVAHSNGNIHSLIFSDESEFTLDALFARVPFTQHSSIGQQLGCALNDMGLITVNDFQLTSVEGVYAAGDNSTMRSLAVAVASGAKAGAFMNKAMIDEEF